MITDLSGNALIPLGTASDPAQADDDSGYRFVASTFTTTGSAILTSLDSASLNFDTANYVVDLSFNCDLSLDFVFTDADGAGVGNDFATGTSKVSRRASKRFLLPDLQQIQLHRSCIGRQPAGVVKLGRGADPCFDELPRRGPAAMQGMHRPQPQSVS